jgi:predicted unusual protein kinase regulating ubiquinone biosynthesis (AarF/ABC1/UbiB family)
MDKLLCKPTDMVVTNEEELEAAIRQCELAHFVVTTGEDTYLKMLLQDNLMHADLHPGNILIEKILHPAEPSEDEADVDEVVESESIKGLKIVLVDAGMVRVYRYLVDSHLLYCMFEW